MNVTSKYNIPHNVIFLQMSTYETRNNSRKFDNNLYYRAISIPEWHIIKESLIVNKDNTNCFLITLKSGGTGLNLTSADIVIHLDVWWNP